MELVLLFLFLMLLTTGGKIDAKPLIKYSIWTWFIYSAAMYFGENQTDPATTGSMILSGFIVVVWLFVDMRRIVKKGD